MAQTLETLTIEIRAQGKEFSSAISQMQSQLKSFESSTKGSLGSIESSVKSIGSSFSSMLSVAAGINLAGIFQSAVSQAESLVTQGIAYNATLEQGKIAIAALLQGTTQLTDSDGKKLTASASWNENLQEAGRLQTEIAGMSATTLGTQEELMNVFRTALAYSRGQHATTSELLEFSQGMLNVGKLQGLNSAQLEIETRQILQLESARGQVVLPLLGYSIQQARSYKDQHNEIQKLNERLAVYKDLAQASATSWTGLTTSASTFTSLISANTFTETFGGIKEILAGFTQESIRLQQAGGLTSELDATGAGLRLLGVVGADAYAGIVRGAANAVNAILEFADAVDQTSHSPAWQAIATALSGGAIKTALVWLVRSIYDLGEVLDDVATAFIARMASLPIALSAAVAAAAQFKNPVEAFLESSKGSGQFENEALADLEFRLKRISGLGEDGKKAFHENLIGTTFASTTTLDQQRASLGPLFNPLTRTGLPGNNSEADAAAKRHATLIKNTQEQIAELAAKNAVLRESLALNLSTNEAEAKAAGAALAQKTGSKELTRT
jgi:hypothetical protein